MTPQASALAIFAYATLALLVVPGPAVVYIVAESAHGGRLAGVVSMLGIHTGGLGHVAAAALGLSSVLASSALAFETVRYVGAAYLVFLGLRRLLGRDRSEPLDAGRPASLGRLFRQGVVVNVLNPKTALFFFAFLPQFVHPQASAPGLQILFLGMVFLALAVISDGAYALAAGTLAGWLRTRPGFHAGERYVSGAVLVGLGTTTALAGSRRVS